MNKHISITILTLSIAFAARAKDKPADYQIGIFQGVGAQSDGTTTNTLHGDGTTIAGSVYTNYVHIYRIKVGNGTWIVEPLVEAQDSMLRGLGMTPMHFKKEKQNPLDFLKNGDKVMFRLYVHHYLNGKNDEMAIPYADNPKNEAKFRANFVPDVSPIEPSKATDNVTAMCSSGKLSAEQQKQFCEAK